MGVNNPCKCNAFSQKRLLLEMFNPSSIISALYSLKSKEFIASPICGKYKIDVAIDITMINLHNKINLLGFILIVLLLDGDNFDSGRNKIRLEHRRYAHGIILISLVSNPDILNIGCNVIRKPKKTAIAQNKITNDTI